MTQPPKIADVLISELRLDGGTDMRAGRDEAWLEQLEDVADDGFKDHRIVIFQEGKTKWLAEGFARVEAAKRAGVGRVFADVYRGTLRDALVWALGKNATNGKPRSREDLKKVFSAIAADAEWAKLANTKIAELVRVSEKTARKYMALLCADRPKTRTVERSGASFPMNVEGLGKKKSPAAGLSAVAQRAFEALPAAQQLQVLEEAEASVPAESSAGPRTDGEPRKRRRGEASPAAEEESVRVVVELPAQVAKRIDGQARARRWGREQWIRWAIDLALSSWPKPVQTSAPERG
jgi:hypothetical protein